MKVEVATVTAIDFFSNLILSSKVLQFSTAWLTLDRRLIIQKPSVRFRVFTGR